MIPLQTLDISIARLDRALARATAAPDDPLTVHELTLCLDFLDQQPLHTGLGSAIDELIAEASDIARRCKPLLPLETHPTWASSATPQELRASEQLRAKLLDLAAAISVLGRD